MAFVSLRSRMLAFAVVLISAFSARAQQLAAGPSNPGSQVAVASTAPAIAQTTALPPAMATVSIKADLRLTTRLSGHVPVWAKASRDAGPVADSSLFKLDLLLKRPAAQQAAFDHLVAAQQDPRSGLFHAWLTPAQIGALYGPAQSDLDMLTAWLAAQGLHVDEVSPSRIFVRISAPAGSVARAFSTSVHLFTLSDGQQLRSATSEPAVPTAFTGLISAIAGLSDTPDLPTSHMGPVVSESTGQAAPDAKPMDPAKPEYTSSSTGNHYITPGDFAILYDVPTQTAINGSGQKVAIIGRSRVNSADITNYQAAVGLAAKLPNTIIPPLGADPGQSGTGDQGEATLDVQRVLGTAPGAQADLVVSTNAAGGLRTAIQYNVQTLLDPVMTISFGACEVNAGYANVELYTNLFAQAAAEGISVFVSAGDSAAAGCDPDFTTPPASQVASINYICSSGFATCVGGTEFNDSANPAQYWSSSNSSTRVSALANIPEGAWNEPMSTGATPVLQVAGGGGGVSLYTPKPSFQAGPGVPGDGFRDVPDVSFSSAGHDSYFGCYTASGATCTVSNGLFYYAGFYGTSAAAPSMAAITALLNQSSGSAQGNLNPLLYRLGASPANGAFHDATVASSGVTNCSVSVPSLCNNSTAGPTGLSGGQPGFLLTAGYDLATGLGSLDVSKFLAAASAAGAPTTATLTGSSGNIPSGQSLSFAVAVNPVTASAATPTGTIQLFANGNAFGAPLALAGGKVSVTLPDTLPVGSTLMTAAYSGDGTFAPASSGGLVLVIVAGTASATPTLTTTPNPTNASQLTTLTVTLAPASGTGVTPGGAVTLYQQVGQTLYTAATGTLFKGTTTFQFYFSAAQFTFVAAYSGDGTYAGSNSAPYTINSVAAPTATALTGATSLPAGSPLSVTATVSNLAYFAVTSTVTFYDGTTALATIPFSKAVGTTATPIPYTGLAGLTTGYHSITAVFTGDGNDQRSTSAPLIVAVGIPQAITLTPAATTLTLSAGASTGNTDVITVASMGAFAGPVSFACTATFNGTGASNYLPTCSATPTLVTLASQGTAATTITIGTTLPHDKSGSKQASVIHPGGGMLLALLAWIPLTLLRRRRSVAVMLTLMLVASGLLLVSGCGGKSGSTPAPAPLVGTTPGAYTVTVVATGSGTGNVTATTTIALTVQ